MKEGLTELVFILDRSGSMSGLEKDTIGGFNSTLQKQKGETGEALVSTILFDNTTEVLHDRIDISKVEPLTDEQYFARGSTALLDAIGGAIHHIGIVHKYAREEDRPEKTVFVITTDGYENSSHKYSLQQVRDMIERQQNKYGWEFLFLGANIDAIAAARDFGIEESNACNFINDKKGIKLQACCESAFISNVRNRRKNSREWKACLEKDYTERSK
jgi:uncharacterized protein YegL